MSHVRRQIRDAFAATLAGLATTEDRVLTGRTRPLAERHQPTLLVYARREESEWSASGQPAPLQRALDVVIEGRVQAGEPPDDLLDTIALEVETALAADALGAIGALAQAWVLRATTIETASPGDVQLGLVRLEYRVDYRTPENDPGVTI